MDKFGNVTVLLTPQMASILAANLPEAELTAAGVDVTNTQNRLLNGAAGGDAPTDIASIEAGYDLNSGNERVDAWSGGTSANPTEYQHGYARGM